MVWEGDWGMKIVRVSVCMNCCTAPYVTSRQSMHGKTMKHSQECLGECEGQCGTNSDTHGQVDRLEHGQEC